MTARGSLDHCHHCLQQSHSICPDSSLQRVVSCLPCSMSATHTRACLVRQCGSMRPTLRRDASAPSTKQVLPGLLATLQVVLHPCTGRTVCLQAAACPVKPAAAQLLPALMSGSGHNDETHPSSEAATTVVSTTLTSTLANLKLM